jgi:WS/DGAT/MGAT family acyltransferase
MVDGVGSVDVGYMMLDTELEPASAPRGGRSRKPPVQTDHSRRSELAGAIRWLPDHLVQAARSGAGLALHPRRALELLERSRATVELLVRDELVKAPETSLNQHMGATRSFAVARAPLADLKATKEALGGTVNDVVLAAVTAGLRRLLEGRGEQLPQVGLRAMVPMNIRQASEKLALGNKVSSLFVHLPVAAETTRDRYRLVTDEAEALKEGTQALGTSTIISLAGMAPPAIHATIARSLYATRLFNVTVTNVPGPQVTLYALGARLREILPLVPLAAEHALGVAIFSYDGNVCFGINAAKDAVPDLDEVRDGIDDELHALRDLAARRHGTVSAEAR